MKKMPHSEIAEILKRLDLNQYESGAYSILLKKSPLTASRVADLANIPRSRAYDVLENLAKRGMVSMAAGRPAKFSAQNIDDAFETLKNKKLEDHNKEVAKIDEIRESIKKKLKDSKQQVSSEDFIWVLKEGANIYPKLHNLLKGASKEVLIVSTENGLQKKLCAYGDTLRDAKKRGANVKIVGPSLDAMKNADFSKAVKRDNVHRAVVVDDHSLLFVTPDESEKEIGILVKSPFFAESIRRLF